MRTFRTDYYYVEVKEDDEQLGVIIDVFDAKTEELIDTHSYWNDDRRSE